MKDDRLRVPVDPSYTGALGLAAYCFSSLEWMAVYCGEKLSPGYLKAAKEKTAGAIAKDIAGFSNRIADEGVRERYESATAKFVQLVKRRNDLLHAHPATVGLDQRLVRHGDPWQPEEIDALADEFTACSGVFNELYYRML